LRFSSSLQVTLLLTGGAEWKRRRSRVRSNWCSGMSAAARGPTCRQWRGRVEQMRRHRSGLLKAIPVISYCFGANFCNFKIG
jgi:hypothetical protein